MSSLGRGGGIGRHDILRGWWAKARGSSNLPLGTKTDLLELKKGGKIKFRAEVVQR